MVRPVDQELHFPLFRKSGKSSATDDAPQVTSFIVVNELPSADRHLSLFLLVNESHWADTAADAAIVAESFFLGAVGLQQGIGEDTAQIDI